MVGIKPKVRVLRLSTLATATPSIALSDATFSTKAYSPQSCSAGGCLLGELLRAGGCLRADRGTRPSGTAPDSWSAALVGIRTRQKSGRVGHTSTTSTCWPLVTLSSWGDVAVKSLTTHVISRTPVWNKRKITV